MLLSDPHNSPPHSLPCELRDYPEWHRGRSRYGLWLLPVQCPALLAHIAWLRLQLADLLHPPGRRQAHISLFICGFSSGLRRHDDDFSKAQLQAQLRDLGRAPGPCLNLQIGAADSFASAAILPIQDPSGQLQAWRQRLAKHASEVRQAPYLPHITLGLYRRSLPAELLRERLNALQLAAPQPLQVRQLHYATYSAHQLFGPLRVRHSLHLGPRPSG